MRPTILSYFVFSVRPWDTQTDVTQFEHQGVIKTQTKHRVRIVKRTSSVLNVSSVSPSVKEKPKQNRMPTIREPPDSDFGSRRNSYDRFVFFPLLMGYNPYFPSSFT